MIKQKKMIETKSASVFRLPNLTASSAWLSVLVDLTAEPGLALKTTCSNLIYSWKFRGIVLSKENRCLSTQLTLGYMRTRYTDYVRKREEKDLFFLEVINTKLKAGEVKLGLGTGGSLGLSVQWKPSSRI